MTVKSLGNPYSSETDLRHGADCGCAGCVTSAVEKQGGPDLTTSEGMLERAVESAIVRSVFGQSDIGRRSLYGHDGRHDDGSGAGLGLSDQRSESRDP